MPVRIIVEVSDHDS